MNQSCFSFSIASWVLHGHSNAPSLVRTSVSHQRKFNYNSIVSYSRQQASQAAQILATPSRVMIRTVDYEFFFFRQANKSDTRIKPLTTVAKKLPKIVYRLTVCAQVP